MESTALRAQKNEIILLNGLSIEQNQSPRGLMKNIDDYFYSLMIDEMKIGLGIASLHHI